VASASCLHATTIPHPPILLFHGYNLLVARRCGGVRATTSGAARWRRRAAWLGLRWVSWARSQWGRPYIKW